MGVDRVRHTHDGRKGAGGQRHIDVIMVLDTQRARPHVGHLAVVTHLEIARAALDLTPAIGHALHVLSHAATQVRNVTLDGAGDGVSSRETVGAVEGNRALVHGALSVTHRLVVGQACDFARLGGPDGMNHAIVLPLRIHPLLEEATERRGSALEEIAEEHLIQVLYRCGAYLVLLGDVLALIARVCVAD